MVELKLPEVTAGYRCVFGSSLVTASARNKARRVWLLEVYLVAIKLSKTWRLMAELWLPALTASSRHLFNGSTPALTLGTWQKRGF